VAEDEQRILRAIAPESCVTVPLQARGEVRGTMTLARTARETPFTRADLELAEDLAGRMALALDNARLYREAQAAAHVRDEVIAVVSHDLRNPLTVVSVTAYNLRNGLKDGPPEMLTQVNKIDRAAMRMSRLIEDLLDITRLESGALPLERQPHSIRELLHEVHELHSTLAEEKAIRFEYSDVAHHWVIDADRHRALQILSNLVGNAIKFTPREGRVRVLAREEPAQFVFSVEDTGPGIKQHQVGHLFNRFWQANRRDRKGTGLGLAIARGLVEAHGGRIWVETKEGAGSTFSFSLPAVRPGASAAAGSTALPDSGARPDQPACG
jgi:signal transduction histidine kinase